LADELDLQLAVGQARLIRLRFLRAEMGIDDVAIRENQRRIVFDLHDDARADALSAEHAADFRLDQGVRADRTGYRRNHVIERVGAGRDLAEADGETAWGQR